MNITEDMFTDRTHPLAHGEPGSKEWEELHALIVGRLRARLEEQRPKFTYESLAPYIPHAKGRGVGLTGERVRQLLDEPETMRPLQVKKFLFFCNCTLDYLRGIVDSPTATADYGDWRYFYLLLKNLSYENRKAMHRIGAALYEQQLREARLIDEDYPDLLAIDLDMGKDSGVLPEGIERDLELREAYYAPMEEAIEAEAEAYNAFLEQLAVENPEAFKRLMDEEYPPLGPE